MRCLSLAVASAAVLLAGVPVAADTPNHCLWDQAAGSWTIYVTAPTPSRDGCPSDSSALAIVDAFNVTLSAPDVATTSSGQAGWWSMLYDEGMHIRLPPASSVGGPGSHFFSFFNWTVDASNNVTSHCNRTNVGDYRAEVVTPGARPDFWGCFYGVKQGSSARDLTVQPLRVVAPAPADAVVVTDHAFAARLNAQQSLWKAGATPAFHGMRMNAARRQAGKVRHHDLAAMKPRMPAGVAKRQPAISAADLPPAFDWRNVSGVDYVCPVRSQGQCGSCYSFGSTGSLCARTAIQTKGAISGRYWSPQAVVSCNPYTQGCDGGFSYDVFFGAEGLGLPWESCFPYTSGADGSVPPCSAMCADQSQFNSVTDVSFVGGYYGGATAELMQEEIYKNGPVSVEFLVIPAFTHYTGGVFACSSVADPEAVGLNPWVATNHEVFIVGWGEEAGTPYWIVQNSWGPAWGEEGYFRIVRGVDECAIESIPASGVPVINAAALAAAQLR